MHSRARGLWFGTLVIGILAFGGLVGCDDDGPYRMTWYNNHTAEVKLRIEGELVAWSGGTYPAGDTLPAGATKTTWLAYQKGHYEYMVFDAQSGNPVICEGRLDLESEDQKFEAVPVPGGTTYGPEGGALCN